MKSIKNIASNISIVLSVALTLCSCSDFLKVDTPLGEVNSEKVFQSESSVQSAVVGLYSQMMTSNNYLLNGGLSLYGGLSADELYNTATNANYDQFRLNALVSTNSIISTNFWRFGYTYIYQANLILENLEGADISEPNKRKYEGEMRFARALCYFYLVNLYGDVPLITITDQSVNRLASRSSINAVYDFIIDDLVKAEILIDGQEIDIERVRPNLYAVKALLARVYLYRKENFKAATKADEVITSNLFQLESDLSKVFLSNSKETIFQMRPTGAVFNTAEGFTFIPTSATARPTLSLYDNLFGTFVSNDRRATQWVTRRTVSGVNYYFPSKYKVRSNAIKTEFNVVLRLAEMYLVRAEAQFDTNSEAAIKDLNTIRRRSGQTIDLANSITELEFRNALMLERQHEFFAEWGHRWLDLKRWNKATDVLSSLKPNWNSTKELYPIPNYEIKYNNNITPNDGYSE